MTILRSGTTQKYSKNWGAAFGEKKRKPKVSAQAKKKSPAKKAAKKSKKK